MSQSEPGLIKGRRAGERRRLRLPDRGPVGRAGALGAVRGGGVLRDVGARFRGVSFPRAPWRVGETSTRPRGAEASAERGDVTERLRRSGFDPRSRVGTPRSSERRRGIGPDHAATGLRSRHQGPSRPAGWGLPELLPILQGVSQRTGSFARRRVAMMRLPGRWRFDLLWPW